MRALLALLLALPLLASARPNIVLIVSDDQGYGDLAIHGATDVETPNLDAIARSGVRFTAFRVNPLCAPTRASILSGLYSLETGMWRGPSNPGREGDGRAREIEKDIRLLPQHLQDAGYATGIFGKWHLGYDPPNTPNTRGFDEFVGFLSGAHPYHETGASPFLRNGEPIRTPKHATDLFADEAIAFIRAHAQESFFCYLPFNAVHGPLWTQDRPRFSAKPEYLAKYEAKGLAPARRDYAATIDHMDARIGDVRRTLRELGVERNTLVVFLSDNGAIIDQYPGDNGPLRGAKGTAYEGGIRVPLFLEWPGVLPAGAVADAQAVHFDLFSTLLEAAAVEAPEANGGYTVHGRSLLAYAKSGGEAAWPERLLFWDLFGKVGVSKGPWKLVGDVGNHRGDFARAAQNVRQEKLELYNLEADLGEQDDLALDQPEVLSDLREKLAAWLEGLD
jgi:arylsulfatase A-like enzyme